MEGLEQVMQGSFIYCWRVRARRAGADGQGHVAGGDAGSRSSPAIGCALAGLLQKMGMEGLEQVRMEATLAAAQDPFEVRFVAQLRERAVDSWQVRGSCPFLPMVLLYFYVCIIYLVFLYFI